jgi:hypothetical protein
MFLLQVIQIRKRTIIHGNSANCEAIRVDGYSSLRAVEDLHCVRKKELFRVVVEATHLYVLECTAHIECNHRRGLLDTTATSQTIPCACVIALPHQYEKKRKHTVLVALPSEIVTKDGVNTAAYQNTDA